MSKPLYNSIKLFIILIIIIVILKPDLIFDKKNNKFKSFGTKKNQTLLSFHTISILLAFVIYIFFLLIDKLQNPETINHHQFIPIYNPIYTPHSMQQLSMPITQPFLQSIPQSIPQSTQYYYCDE